MNLDPACLQRVLRGLQSPQTSPARYLVALSGGLDSTVLLHALAATRGSHAVPLAAVHVDHGLHRESGRFAALAADFAKSLDVHCEIVTISVGSGAGPEAAARDARYSALASRMRAGDWLITAHHADDQAETLLLNLLRGSGPEGLAAMPPIRPFGPGFLVRPLLGAARADLATYAAEAGLAWNDDPSNADQSLDRNYLRQQVLPNLRARWPHAVRRLGRSAELNREAARLLREIADREIEALRTPDGELPAAALRELPSATKGRILRRAVERAGLPQVPPGAFGEILNSLLGARADSNPLVSWHGGHCRRFRDTLYLLPPEPEPAFEGRRLAPGRPVDLGAGLGRLMLEKIAITGIAPALAEAGLVLQARRGGEEIKPLGHEHTRKLKKLLQDHGVFPWLRDSLPILYAGSELVAVADLWIAAAAAATPGYAIRWHDAPRYA